MGGRYNKLAKQFGACILEISFACDTDALLKSTQEQEDTCEPSIDVVIYYDQDRQESGLSAAK